MLFEPPNRKKHKYNMQKLANAIETHASRAERCNGPSRCTRGIKLLSETRQSTTTENFSITRSTSPKDLGWLHASYVARASRVAVALAATCHPVSISLNTAPLFTAGRGTFCNDIAIRKEAVDKVGG